eukprot:14174-Heterococcus_DN1.PRE.1
MLGVAAVRTTTLLRQLSFAATKGQLSPSHSIKQHAVYLLIITAAANSSGAKPSPPADPKQRLLQTSSSSSGRSAIDSTATTSMAVSNAAVLYSVLDLIGLIENRLLKTKLPLCSSAKVAAAGVTRR